MHSGANPHHTALSHATSTVCRAPVGAAHTARQHMPDVCLCAAAVEKDIARQLALKDPVLVLTGFDRANLSYHVIATKNDGVKDATVDRWEEKLRASFLSKCPDGSEKI